MEARTYLEMLESLSRPIKKEYSRLVWLWYSLLQRILETGGIRTMED